MQKRLLELFREIGASFERELPEEIASYLLANGVIVQAQGHWTIKTDDYDCEYMVCSCCGEEFYNADEDTVDRTPKYCPNCGAKMNGLAEREGKG